VILDQLQPAAIVMRKDFLALVQMASEERGRAITQWRLMVTPPNSKGTLAPQAHKFSVAL
jgi:hypothetical protein